MAQGRKLVSGPGYSGESQGLSAQELAIAEAEAEAPRAVLGQDNANQFYRDVANNGLAESGVPEQIFHGAALDPEDRADGAPRKMVGRSGMRERYGADMAIGRVDARLAKEYGINLETHVAKYCLMDGYGGNGRNFEQEWLTDNPDGEICFNANREKYNMQGLVLVKLPREVQDEIDRENYDLAFKKRDAAKERGDLLPSDPREVEKAKRDTSAAVEALLRGSVTSGRQLEDAMAMFTPEHTKSEMEKYRYAFAPKRTSQEAENAADRIVQTAQAATSGRKNFAGAGDNGKLWGEDGKMRTAQTA